MNHSTGKKETVMNTEQKDLQNFVSAKTIQYIMLAVLLVLVFIVPAYGGIMRMRKNAQNQRGETGITGDVPENPDNNAVEGAEGSGDDATGKSDNGTAEKTGESDGTVQTKGTIVLDAGHGGFDSGVSGASGVAERELNLIIAKKLEALLAEKGYLVVQTRPTQEGLYDEGQTHKKAQDMQRRCAVIEAAQPLLTVSIHQNSYPNVSVNGPQVFYFAQSKEGERLASSIQNCMNEQLEPKNPKTHKGNESYYIIRRSAGTTVIVECGFLTNPDEEAKLQQEEYQDRVAQAICDGILQYLDSTQ